MQAKRWLKRVGWLLLVLVSLALIFNQQIKYYLVGSYRPTITKTLVQKNQQKQVNQKDFDFSQTKDLNFQAVAKARANKQAVNIIGEISIPAIKMTIPIATGVSNTTLALAAGTMRPDQQMGQGNYALAGHNMAHGSKILFSPLYYHAKVGQKVYLTDMRHVYTYRIYERKFILATRVDVVNDTPKKILTLITCDATGANRLMVRAKYEGKVAFDQAPKHVQQALSSKYTNQ
ncbi:class A sortase [Limosilactobacillus ingluviei]|uniref:class A sortase n=1 Tax=Limosilactobacillus ingluviei TaxID=148604 RepID=UPI00265F6148|nr:class A sortase [Limosilactobacillus ingluviei]